MSDPVRLWMLAYRDKLRQRIDAIDAMIAEMNEPPVLMGGTMTGPLPPIPKPKPAPRAKKAKPRREPPKAAKMAMVALEAAGTAGMTSRELAEVSLLPIGTASSRLAIMARDGTVRHDRNSHRYFAQHSSREDNNVEAR